MTSSRFEALNQSREGALKAVLHQGCTYSISTGITSWYFLSLFSDQRYYDNGIIIYFPRTVSDFHHRSRGSQTTYRKSRVVLAVSPENRVAVFYTLCARRMVKR